jgi:hypothetical protein
MFTLRIAMTTWTFVAWMDAVKFATTSNIDLRLLLYVMEKVDSDTKSKKDRNDADG